MPPTKRMITRLSLLFCALVSLVMIARMWYVHRRDSLAKKLLWTCILGVPFVGWIFYGGFYTPLEENSTRCHENSDATSAGH